MTALVNPYFQKNSPLEQKLLEVLINESIQVMGNKYYYLPRTIQREDLILGEDIISKFEFALEIEMLHEQTKGWTAETTLMNKFGLQIQNEIVFVMSKAAWDAEIASYTQLQSMKTYGYRPQEGDLIYEPVSKSLLEIKYVKDTNTDFFQLGKVYQFQLTCEFFMYDSEKINTGVPEIDFFNQHSLDLLDHQMKTEDESNIVYEDCGYIILDEVDVKTQDEMVIGTDFSVEASAIGFDARNPFGEL